MGCERIRKVKFLWFYYTFYDFMFLYLGGIYDINVFIGTVDISNTILQIRKS